MRELEARYLLPSTHLHSALLSEEDRRAWEAGLVTIGVCADGHVRPAGSGSRQRKGLNWSLKEESAGVQAQCSRQSSPQGVALPEPCLSHPQRGPRPLPLP